MFIIVLQLYTSIHSYGQKIIYPWSYTADKIYDWRELESMGHAMADNMFHASKGRDKYRVRQPKQTLFKGI